MGDETAGSFRRDEQGRFARGGKGGPGRMPRAGLEKYVQAAKLLSPRSESTSNGLRVLGLGAPQAAARLVRIATRSKNEVAAQRAAETILAYVHGQPVQRALIAATGVDVASSPEERRARLDAILSRIRELPQVIDARPVGEEAALDERG